MAKWSSATQTEDIALLIEKKNQNRSLRSFKIVRTSTMTNWNQTVISIERLWWAEQATLSLCPWRKMKVNLVRQYMCVVCVCAATCLPHGLWVLCWLYVTHEWWDMESIDYDAVECHRHRRERVKDEDWCNFGRYERVKRLVWMMLIWLCLLLFISSCQFVSLSTDFPNYCNIFLVLAD